MSARVHEWLIYLQVQSPQTTQEYVVMLTLHFEELGTDH